MKQYHINSNTGAPVVCEARQRACPVKDVHGDEVPHFEGSLKDARTWAEQQNEREASGAYLESLRSDSRQEVYREVAGREGAVSLPADLSEDEEMFSEQMDDFTDEVRHMAQGVRRADWATTWLTVSRSNLVRVGLDEESGRVRMSLHRYREGAPAEDELFMEDNSPEYVKRVLSERFGLGASVARNERMHR